MTNKLLVVRLILISALLAAGTAQAIEQKGVAEINYRGTLDADERDEARNAAMRNAIETWIAEKQQSQYRNYERVKAEIDSNVEDYVLSHVIISEDQNEEAQRVRIVLRANLNEPKLMATLLGPSAAASASSEPQYLTFVFVAREQIGTTSATEKSATQEKSRTQSIGRERTEDTAAQTKTQSQTVTVRKEERNLVDQVLWDVSTSNEIDSAVGEVFAEARYRTVDPSIVGVGDQVLDPDQFVADYRTGNDILPQTKRSAYRTLSGLRGTDDEIQYFAIGTLDVESSEIDEASGNIRVAVSVTAEVWSILERGAVVAKTGPVTNIGEGPTELVAKNNALKIAARNAAGDLIAQLSSNDIR